MTVLGGLRFMLLSRRRHRTGATRPLATDEVATLNEALAFLAASGAVVRWLSIGPGVDALIATARMPDGYQASVTAIDDTADFLRPLVTAVDDLRAAMKVG